MQVTPGHLFAQLNFRDVEVSDHRVVIELDNRPDLVNRRGALHGGLVATLIDIAVDVVDAARDRFAARATLSFAVLDAR